MKFRHAAALVGWYLMVPPSVATSPDSSRVSIQSISKEWRILTRTDNAEECAHLLQFALTHKPFTMGETRTAVYCCGVCVREDDPRLKGISKAW